MEQDLKINNRTEKTEIEIWDVSGDLKYLFETNLKFHIEKIIKFNKK